MSSIFQKPPNNYLYQIGIENVVDVDTDDITITGVVTDGVLGSVLIPKNTLVQNGQELRLKTGGFTTGTGSKNFRLRFNTTSQFFSAVGITPTNNTGWMLWLSLFRRSSLAAAVEFMFQYNIGSSPGGVAPTILSSFNVSLTLPGSGTFETLDLLIEMVGTINVAAETIRQTKMMATII